MSRAFASLVVVVAVWGSAADVRAQPVAPAGRVEAGFGVLWLGDTLLGSRDATETTNAGGTFRLFSTSTQITSMAGLEGRIAVRLSQAIEAEASATRGVPQLRTTISNDFETSDTVVATETVTQFTIGGAVLWYVPARRWPRLWTFVTGGAGYLRQLHESGTLAVSGGTYQVGGGLKYLLVSRPASSRASSLKGMGVRADARLMTRRKGVAFDDRTRLAPALGMSIFARF